MKKIFFMLIVLSIISILSSFSFASSKESNLRFGAVRSLMLNDNEFEVHYNVWNYGDGKSERGNFNMYIPDIDYNYGNSGEDIDENEGFGQRTYHFYEGIKPGTYLARLVYQDDDSRTVKWVLLDIY